MEVTARVPTTSGGKYVRQLAKHWSHKLEVEQDGDSATVRFPDTVAVMAADGDAIDVSISGEDAETVERMKGVVSSHLDRFAFREAPLSFDWQAV